MLRVDRMPSISAVGGGIRARAGFSGSTSFSWAVEPPGSGPTADMAQIYLLQGTGQGVRGRRRPVCNYAASDLRQASHWQRSCTLGVRGRRRPVCNYAASDLPDAASSESIAPVETRSVTTTPD